MTKELKKQITNFIFATCCLICFFAFPIDQYKFEIVIGVVVFLVVLPVLYMRFVLGENWRALGLRTYHLHMHDCVFLIGSVIIGSLVSFGIIKMGWGVKSYVESLSAAVLYDFRGFIIYEMIFTLAAIMLFVFFSWGFVYHRTWKNHNAAYISALLAFLVLIANYYQSPWMVVPILFPVGVYYFMRDRVNIVYLFCALFAVNLVIDTLIITLTT